MLAMATAMTMMAEPVPAGDFIPDAEDFRIQEIHEVAGEEDWPFVAASGRLLCAFSLGQRLTYFMPENGDRPFALGPDPFAAALANMGNQDLLKPYGGDFKVLIERVAPYAAMAYRLCDQKPGTVVTGSEL